MLQSGKDRLGWKGLEYLIRFSGTYQLEEWAAEPYRVGQH